VFVSSEKPPHDGDLSGAQLGARERASSGAFGHSGCVHDDPLAPVHTGLGTPPFPPSPGRTRHPVPTKILSRDQLRVAWRASRDASSKPGRPGLDNVKAGVFEARLEHNISRAAEDLRSGRYGFSDLRPVFIQKPNSQKERLICVPTVRDRLVQRAMCAYLERRRKFRIYNPISYGFVKGRSANDAVTQAVRLRSSCTWVLKRTSSSSLTAFLATT
jgi:hypothetical protein